jgi:virginiamycin B lyase
MAALAISTLGWGQAPFDVRYYDVPKGGRPHDVAPAPDGTVWYTAQRQGALGRLDPATSKTEQIPLGEGSAPHGVIVGPDGAAWVTDGGLNAMVRVDPQTKVVKVWKLPEDRGYTNLNTATFDNNGVLWFTGQSGIYGQLNPQTGDMKVYNAPRGRGPYGITTTPSGEVYYASLAGNHIARIDTNSGQATVIEPPTPGQGARRVWADSKSRVWVSEWNSGNVSLYDPSTQRWQTWKLPGEKPQAYSIYVDEEDIIWLTDFTANAIVRFDPQTQEFQRFQSDRSNAHVRQMLGRKGEVWGAESGVDRLVVITATTAGR